MANTRKVTNTSKYINSLNLIYHCEVVEEALRYFGKDGAYFFLLVNFTKQSIKFY